MANDFRVNLYEKVTRLGVTTIRPVGPSGTGGGGWDGQRKMRGIVENATVIYSLGRSSNDERVFEVNMNGAPSFITDWAGLDDFNFVRVNKYARTVQEDGSRKWQYFGLYANSSARVVAANVATCVALQQNGVDQNGDDQGQECFRITMIDGEVFVTDRDGWNDIENEL
jgi:hypothetical protein